MPSNHTTRRLRQNVMANRVRDIDLTASWSSQIIREENTTTNQCLVVSLGSCSHFHFPVNGLTDRLPLQALAKSNSTRKSHYPDRLYGEFDLIVNTAALHRDPLLHLPIGLRCTPQTGSAWGAPASYVTPLR